MTKKVTSLFDAAEPCLHPTKMRKWVGHVMYCHKPRGGCGAELRRDAEADAPVKEPCGWATTCIHAGDDCSDEGFTNRKGECFEDATEEAKNPAIDATSDKPCHNVVCDAFVNDPNVENCLRNFGEDATRPFEACETFVDSTISPETAGCSASIPTLSEAMVTGETVNVTRMLPVKIHDDELAENGEEMARLIGIWTRAKCDLKNYQKASKKVIDETEERYIEIALIVDSGCIEKEIQCVLIYDYPHGLKRVYRCDTNALVEETTLTTEELQGSLNFSVDASVAAAEALRQENAPEPDGELHSDEEVDGMLDESPFNDVEETPQDEQALTETGEQAKVEAMPAEEREKAVTGENMDEGWPELPKDVA